MYKFEKRSKKEYLKAVKQSGYALQYVKEQDKEICLEAVKQDGDALQYVKEYYKEILELKSVYMNAYIETFKEENVKEITIEELEKQYGCKVKIIK